MWLCAIFKFVADRRYLYCPCTSQVAWRKQDEIHPLTIGLFQFAPDTRVSVDYNQRTTEWSLIIQDVRPTDEGTYRCQISTKHERDSYDVRLNVKSMLFCSFYKLQNIFYTVYGYINKKRFKDHEARCVEQKLAVLDQAAWYVWIEH